MFVARIFVARIFLKNRSEVKQEGLFTRSKPAQDVITEERKIPTQRSLRITSSRITITPQAVDRPMRLIPITPNEDRNEPRPTHVAPRTLHPLTRSVTYTSHKIKVDTPDDEDQSSEAVLLPSTTALTVKKPVRLVKHYFFLEDIIDICIKFTCR